MLKLFNRPPPRSTNEIEEKWKRANAEKPVSARRSSVKILAIDDKKFAPEVNLSNLGFKIATMRDIQNVSQALDYQIVLCDLMGIGRRIDPILQGATVIRELKAEYPEKYVVAYTGGSPLPGMQDGILLADRFIQKDAGIGEWTDLLDSMIAEITNPAVLWRRSRERLLELGITPYQLALLEDAFVKELDSGTVSGAAISSIGNKLKVAKKAIEVAANIATIAAALIGAPTP